jgi:hypothetical protein
VAAQAAAAPTFLSARKGLGLARGGTRFPYRKLFGVFFLLADAEKFKPILFLCANVPGREDTEKKGKRWHKGACASVCRVRQPGVGSWRSGARNSCRVVSSVLMLKLSNSETGTGTMPFAKGQSGNPAGRPRKHIADLSREARRYADLALRTLVKICKDGAERNRLAAASALLDRGYGRPVTAIDLITAGKKLSELSQAELEAFEARLISNASEDVEPAQSDMFH